MALVAAAAVDFGHGLQVAGVHADAGANPVPVALHAPQLHLQPPPHRRGVVAEQGRFTPAVEHHHVHVAVIVQVVERGAAFDDLDNDGDVDVVVLNSRREPTLLRNDSPPVGRWLQVQLRGVKSNRDGIGARVSVDAGDLKSVAEVHSGRSYQSHYGTRLHFGLGPNDRVNRIEVRWIGGGRDVVRNVPAGRLVTLIEGVGLTPPAPSTSR